MKFLWPALGVVPDGFNGVFVTPGYGMAYGIKNGMQWASDNGGYKGFEWDKFKKHLDLLQPYKDRCLFIAAPDKLADCKETIDMFNEYQPLLSEWSLAFIAQDGQELLDFPDTRLWSTLFIGGSSGWKDSSGAIDCIKRAQELGKQIHIGRVNRYKRYKLFASLYGSKDFTCDGTRLRFERDKAIADWLSMMRKEHNTNEEYQLRFPIFVCNYSG